MTEAEQAALEAARQELEQMFPESRVMAVEDMRRDKERARVSDWNRIANGEATPEQIQGENSPWTQEQVRTFRICNLEQVLAQLQ